MSRYWRTLWTNFLVGIALDYGICIVVSMVLFERDHAFNALLLLLALWAVQIVLGIKAVIVSVATYYLYRRKRLIRESEFLLRKERFPFYDDGAMFDAIEYMARVSQDLKASPKQISTAASWAGYVEALKTTKPSLAMQAMSAMDKALDNYRDELVRLVDSDLERLEKNHPYSKEP